MSDSPTAVVVGSGFGCLTHVPALRGAGFRVVCLVGRDPERTRARAERMEIPAADTSLSAALSSGVDLVAVVTPPHTHAPLVLEAIEAGCHVLCEKPFARDRAEAEVMLRAAEEAGVIHLLGTEFRFSAGQATATRAIRAGVIGQPRLVTHLLCVPMLTSPDAEVPRWWTDEDHGGGWLGAQGSHVLDQMSEMLGPISGVSATLGNVIERPWSAEDAFTVHFETATGAAGVLQSSIATYGPPLMTTRVAGSEGTLWIEFDKVRVADASGERELEPPPELVSELQPPPADLLVTDYDRLHSFGTDLGPYTLLYRAGAALMAGGQEVDPAPATFADGVRNMALLDAIRASAAGGGWVTPDA